MIIKTTIGLLLTASLAGGAVYYGTQDGIGNFEEVSLNEHPHKAVEDDINVDQEAETEETTDSNVSTIDRLMNKPEDQESVPDVDSETAIPNQDEISEDTDLPTDDQVAVSSDMNEENVAIVADVLPANDLFDFAMAQAERIESVEIRDQAYLDIVDYACKTKDYPRAQATTGIISQPQLRDKARSHIAISMAERGMSDAAITEIDKVETPELRDVMRLKVLQALIQK